MSHASVQESTPGPGDILDTPMAGPAAIRGGALRVIGYAAGVIATVISAALLFRQLGVDDSGRYITVLSLVTIASGLVDFGLTTIGIRELAVRPRAEADRLVRNLIGLRLALTGAGLTAAVAFAVAVGYPRAMVLGTLLAGIGTLLAAAQNTLAATLMVDLRLGWLTLLELLRQVLVALAIGLLAVAGATLLPFLATTIPAAVIVLALTIVLVRREVSIAPAFDLTEWRAVLRQMVPYAAATALSSIYFRVAVVLVSLLGTSREAGFFGASFRVIEVLLLIPGLIVSAGLPIFARAARDDHERLGYGVSRMFETGTLIGAWVASSLIAGAPFVIEVIAGPDFAPAEGVLRIQAVGLLATFAGAVFFYALLSLHRQVALLVLTGGAFVLNLILVTVLLPALGPEGAALGTVIAEVVLVASGGVYLRRVVPSVKLEVMTALRCAPPFAVCASLALVPGVPHAALAMVAAALFPLLAILCGAVPREVIVEVRRFGAALPSFGRS